MLHRMPGMPRELNPPVFFLLTQNDSPRYLAPPGKHLLVLQLHASFRTLAQLRCDFSSFFPTIMRGVGELSLASHHPTPREKTVSFHHSARSWPMFGTDTPLYYLTSGACVSIKVIKLHKITFQSMKTTLL